MSFSTAVDLLYEFKQQIVGIDKVPPPGGESTLECFNDSRADTRGSKWAHIDLFGPDRGLHAENLALFSRCQTPE